MIGKMQAGKQAVGTCDIGSRLKELLYKTDKAVKEYLELQCKGHHCAPEFTTCRIFDKHNRKPLHEISRVAEIKESRDHCMRVPSIVLTLKEI